MSGQVVTWVRRHSRARTPVQQAVLVELALAADEQGLGASRPYREIARRTKLHRNTVLGALRELEREDRIRRHVGGREHCGTCRRAGRVAVYDLVIPVGVEVPDGQMNLLAIGTPDRHTDVPSDVPSENGDRHTTCAVDGTPGVPLKEEGSTSKTPSLPLAHAASGVGPGDRTTSRGEDFPVTTRAQAQAVACPACGAGAGRMCRRADGSERVQCHRERHAAAIAAGAAPIDPAARRDRAARLRPGSRANGTNPRARGTNPRARAAEHQPATVEDQLAWQAVREQLRQSTPEGTWELWLAPLTLVGRDHDALVLGAPNPGYLQASFSRLLAECAAAARPGLRVLIEHAEQREAVSA